MLVQASFQAEDVVTFKMTNGDEIVARVKEVKSNSVVITKPLLMILQMIPQRGPNGQVIEQPAVSFAPYMLSAPEDSRIEIENSKFLFATKTRRDAADQYTRATSKIEVASGMPDLGDLQGLVQK